MSNLAEYMASTSPTNGSSVLKIMGLSLQSNAVRVAWQGGTLARQVVERTAEKYREAYERLTSV